MKKIRLTESDLLKIVKRIIKESGKINEYHLQKPGDRIMDLMVKYDVDILPDNSVLKDGEFLGKIEPHMVPSGKYFVRDNNKRHLELKDSFEEALKDLIDNKSI